MSSVVEEVKARTDIVEIIGETVALKKRRNYYSGLCPFHPHVNNTPSFVVWPDSAGWKCFGQCNTGGDVFAFVMKKDGVDFSEALRILARRAGIELRQRTPEQTAVEEKHDHLRELLAEAATYYQNLLLHAPQAAGARDHILKRGLNVLSVQKFQLGYALDGWEGLASHFAAKGVPRQDLIEAGLLIERQDGSGVYDRFRNRLMIPILDGSGKMAGFGARALNPADTPKFLNSPQTVLFDKGRTVYGLSFARKAMRENGTVVIVEGYMDVIAAHQAGFANVVSPMGIALTEDQIRQLVRFAKRIVLALDADTAGNQATLRGLSVAHESLDREYQPGFDPRGLLRMEGRLRADVRAVTLPAGKDPDEVILGAPDVWRKLIDGAQPVVDYVMRALAAGRDLDDPKTKVEIADSVLPLIDDVADPVERSDYLQRLARFLKVDHRALLEKRSQPPKTRRRPAAAAEAPLRPQAQVKFVGERSASKLEAYCLKVLARQPELLHKADRHLQSLGLDRLSEEDFTDAGHRAIFNAVKASLAQDAAEPADYLREKLDEALLPVLDALQETEPPKNEVPKGGRVAEPAADDTLRTVTRLRRRSVDSTLTHLRFLVEDAQTLGEAPAAGLMQTIARLAGARHKLDRALSGAL